MQLDEVAAGCSGVGSCPPGRPPLRFSQVKSQDKARGVFVTFACWEKDAVRGLLQPVDS